MLLFSSCDAASSYSFKFELSGDLAPGDESYYELCNSFHVGASDILDIYDFKWLELELYSFSELRLGSSVDTYLIILFLDIYKR